MVLAQTNEMFLAGCDFFEDESPCLVTRNALILADLTRVRYRRVLPEVDLSAREWFGSDEHRPFDAAPGLDDQLPRPMEFGVLDLAVTE